MVWYGNTKQYTQVTQVSSWRINSLNFSDWLPYKACVMLDYCIHVYIVIHGYGRVANNLSGICPNHLEMHNMPCFSCCTV